MNWLLRSVNNYVRYHKGQLALLASIVETFKSPTESFRNLTSNVASEDFLVAFGDILKLHHTLSDDYLDKHRFEASVERVCRALDIPASRPTRNNPGHDITVSGVPWSLKTQEARKENSRSKT